MNKSEQFILMVQTGLILYYIKKTDFETACAFWAMDHLDTAVEVAQRIPHDAKPAEAASHFLRWIMRTEDYDPTDCLEWFLRPEDVVLADE